MKVTHIWSVLCSESVINSDNNEISLLNILEHIKVDAVTKDQVNLNKDINLPIKYEIVSFWLKSDATKEIQGYVDISVKTPGKKEKKLFSQKMIIPANNKRLRTRLKIYGLVVDENGTYEFIVSYRESEKEKAKIVANLPLEVTVNKQLQSSKPHLTS